MGCCTVAKFETNAEFKAVSWNREISLGLCFLASLDLMEPEVVGMVTCVEGFKPLGMTSHTTELKKPPGKNFSLVAVRGTIGAWGVF